jgi:hypothetical protein
MADVTYTSNRAKATTAFDGAWDKMFQAFKDAQSDDPKVAKEAAIRLKQLEQLFQTINSSIDSILACEKITTQSPR